MMDGWDETLSPVSGPPLQPGDAAPWFKARTQSNPEYGFNTVGGRYVVLCFYGTLGEGRGREIVQRLLGRWRNRFDDDTTVFFGVSLDPEDEATGRARQMVPGVRHFFDFDGAVTRLFVAGEPSAQRLAQDGFTLLFDPFLRVIANIPFSDPAAHEAAFAAVFGTLPPPDRHTGAEVPAPVLVLPRVFEPAFCRALIELYESRGGNVSGFMRQGKGETYGVIDNSFKRRRDVNLEEEEAWEPFRLGIRARVARRVAPAIRQAFNFGVTRIERYLVACYDAEEGGFFRAHRDNQTMATAHRRFAVTINLNAEEFDGGELRFPEFGQRSYRAPTGGAVVFGCGLLHEALPVTRGRRYACLPFLYDEEGARIRARNLQFLSDKVVDKDADRAAGKPVTA